MAKLENYHQIIKQVLTEYAESIQQVEQGETITLSQELSTQEQNRESTSRRRTVRQKRVKNILRIIGFPSGGIGIVVTVNLLRIGDLQNAVIIGFLTFTVTIIAITAKFISELYNSVLDKIEEKLEDKTEPLATWIVNSLEKGISPRC